MTIDTAPIRLATKGQLRDLAIALAAFGLSERSEALGYCSAIAGRPIQSRKTLSTREASKILDHLEHHLPPRRVRFRGEAGSRADCRRPSADADCSALPAPSNSQKGH